MAEGSTRIKEIKLEEMAELRSASKSIAAALQKELEGHLKTLTPLFSPRKVLGEFMQSASRDKVAGAERNYALLEENYRAIMRDAFGHAARLATPLAPIPNRLKLAPWTYPDECGTGTPVIFTSPVRWVLSYDNSYDLSWLVEDRTRNEQPAYDVISPFVLQSLALWLLLENNPGLVRLLEGLGYRMTIERLPALAGELPLVVLSSKVQSFRPQDELVAMVAQLSGAATFEELVDVAAIAAIESGIKQRMQAFVGLQ